MGDLHLVVGGCRSGKSSFAIELAQKLGRERSFLATAQAYDDEMSERIRRHKLERDNSWRTIEEPVDILSALENHGPFEVLLFDCLTLWISNLMINNLEDTEIYRQTDLVITGLRERCQNAVIVSNEVGMGVVPENKMARRFRDLTGRCHQIIKQHAKETYVMAVGTPIPLNRLTQMLSDPIHGN